MMGVLQSRASATTRVANSYPLFVEQIVSEILQAQSLPEVSYLMARMLGAKHLVDASLPLQELGEPVRRAILPLLEHSSQLAWYSQKPYGYAGDFMALETIYENTVSPSSTPLGHLMDRWLLGTQLASGVRERKDILSAFIAHKVRAHKMISDQPFKLLSLASGSARELRDLPDEQLQSIDITLVDQDPRSLEFAVSHLPEGVNGMQRNALRLKASSFPHAYDLVYSFGFFDYLSDDLIVHCLKLCRATVAEGGSIIFPLKMDSRFRHWFYDVFVDWRFVKRELEDGFRLAQQAGLEVVELLETENQSVVFYHCVPRNP